MTDHPCRGMTDAQIGAFERVAIGMNPMAGERTLAKLLERGLIVRGPDRQLSSALGPIRIAQYDVPIPIHMQWCEWCAEQEDNIP